MVWYGAREYSPEQYSGYWGIPSSTIDWCEENYAVSNYLAEFVNTLTNAIFILLAFYALRNAIKNEFEFRFVLVSFGFMLVGIGSWLFHMTLQYDFQLLDELPMIYATCIPFWSVFQVKKSKKESIQIAISVFLGAATLTAVYLYFKDPTIHQVAYALLTITVLAKSVLQAQAYVHDPVAQKHLRLTLISGVCEFLGAWGLWNADIHLCGFWRQLRHEVGIPYGFIFELHGWWHLLTGLAVYKYLMYLEYLRSFILGTNESYTYKWKLGFIPVCCKKENEKLE